MLGFGILMTALAVYFVTGRRGFLRWGVPTALLVSFGRFLVSNVVLHSEFLWFIGVLFVISVATAIVFTFPPAKTAKASENVPSAPSGV